MKRVFILMMDSFGIGAAADADKFGDVGSDTLGHIAEQCAAGKADNAERSGALKLPNLTKLGLALAAKESTGRVPAGMDGDAEVIGGYAFAKEISSGKDTPSGHWEIAGVPVLFDWGYFKDHQNSFPQELLDRIVAKSGIPGYLGNCHSSGTVVLDDLGEEHMKTGKPIFYTSADSVFQIACHEETYGLEKLYELCHIVREELEGYNIGRVIARPFVGDKAGNFKRTGNRHDYSVQPPSATVLQKLVDEKQGEVVSIGKIADIYAHTGITSKVKATGLEEIYDKTIVEIKAAGDNTIVFPNFVNFDSDYGHRRDVAGYAQALEYFDSRLPEVLKLVEEGDLLIITADHGCDPTWTGTDHTREHVPVLLYGSEVPKGFLGKRETFADIGQTIANYFDLSPMDYGTSMINFNK
ncbi:phosphopentomutase [Testudinibacter sp. TR-2022]|uniref:phosphopentomutase n=1 Tax=Testudinibacter sp. TR-2022 TaxID=2585029 RepID=UPI001118453C|nr:phosphopentomutase [Testudinibacter sp. TR-2022]TNH02980.1 phosphopentomutase [Pasteurellaceae bacterium Phil31]TNH10396.1 phosphopentomutase [Testudinibacter sp. TR-2022]TNH12376.1 phosphopentomutase [Testudinibacter sp. TR-2022]TNH14040.1 phosphopentomutase [Testudinibacter sp. TR-2022]TNH15444.1 phosphopentomutase [Testudinibacter sp. TR-2022]